MANIKSAKKRIDRNDKRRVVNKNRISRVRTFIKKVESAILSGNKTAAAEAFKELQPELARGASKGIVHKNFVARQMSRLNNGIKKLVG